MLLEYESVNKNNTRKIRKAGIIGLVATVLGLGTVFYRENRPLELEGDIIVKINPYKKEAKVIEYNLTLNKIEEIIAKARDLSPDKAHPFIYLHSTSPDSGPETRWELYTLTCELLKEKENEISLSNEESVVKYLNWAPEKTALFDTIVTKGTPYILGTFSIVAAGSLSRMAYLAMRNKYSTRK